MDRLKTNDAFLEFSIIIPVRNEAANIIQLLTDIKNQDYPLEKFEVFIINDHSTDQTEALVKNFVLQNSNFKLINLGKSLFLNSHKKKAIETGIFQSKGEIIITTDGDCRVGSKWIKSINNGFLTTSAVCLCGPVTYLDKDIFFNKLQIIEFAALLGSGAATINLGLPGMCNGANLAYKREVFDKVQGFKGIDNIASGDDELLMHKILKVFPGRVLFLKDKEAIVKTEGNTTLKQLFNQRKRWASKWPYYKSGWVKALAILIFSVNCYLTFSWIALFVGFIAWKTFLIQYLLKATFESIFIFSILKFLKKKIHLFHFVCLQILYPFYTTFFGIVANFGSFEWKERKLNA